MSSITLPALRLYVHRLEYTNFSGVGVLKKFDAEYGYVYLNIHHKLQKSNCESCSAVFWPVPGEALAFFGIF